MNVPCEIWAATDRKRRADDKAIIMAIIFEWLGFDIIPYPVDEEPE